MESTILLPLFAFQHQTLFGVMISCVFFFLSFACFSLFKETSTLIPLIVRDAIATNQIDFWARLKKFNARNAHTHNVIQRCGKNSLLAQTHTWQYIHMYELRTVPDHTLESQSASQCTSLIHS